MSLVSVEVDLPYNVTALNHIPQAVLRQHAYQHEMALVTVDRTTGDKIRARVGDPVQVTFRGGSGQPYVFVGHVYEIREAAHRSARQHENVLVCAGPTYKMKTAVTKTWRNVTISDVARELCLKYRLTADVETHTHRISTIHQAGESDWQFLCRIARQYGWVVYGTGTTLHLQSWDRNWTVKARSAPLLTYNEQKPTSSTIYEFKQSVGDSIPRPEGTKSQRVISDVDLKTGAIYSVGDDGTPATVTRSTATSGQFRAYDHQTTGSLQDAQAKLTGAQLRSQWAYQSSALLRGRTDVAPTSLLYLANLKNGFDGYWTVLGVDHTFENKLTYKMQTTLGTHSLGSPVSNYKPDQYIPGDLLATLSRPAPAKLLGTGSTASQAFLATRGSQDSPFQWVSTMKSTDPPAAKPSRSPTIQQRLARVTKH